MPTFSVGDRIRCGSYFGTITELGAGEREGIAHVKLPTGGGVTSLAALTAVVPVGSAFNGEFAIADGMALGDPLALFQHAPDKSPEGTYWSAIVTSGKPAHRMFLDRPRNATRAQLFKVGSPLLKVGAVLEIGSKVTSERFYGVIVGISTDRLIVERRATMAAAFRKPGAPVPVEARVALAREAFLSLSAPERMALFQELGESSAAISLELFEALKAMRS